MKDRVVKCMDPIGVIEENYQLSFTPGSDHILGVVGRYVYVRLEGYVSVPDADSDLAEIVFKGEVVDKIAVLRVTINEFLRFQKSWLMGKKHHCELYGHWCGVFGNFHIEKFRVVGFERLTMYDDTKDVDDPDCIYYQEVPVIQVLQWNEHPDFEHG